MLGPVRQEVLSGYSNKSKFDKLKYVEDTQIVDDDYVQAATFSNTCRSKGAQGSHIDFLICAVAFREYGVNSFHAILLILFYLTGKMWRGKT